MNISLAWSFSLHANDFFQLVVAAAAAFAAVTNAVRSNWNGCSFLWCMHYYKCCIIHKQHLLGQNHPFWGRWCVCVMITKVERRRQMFRSLKFTHTQTQTQTHGIKCCDWLSVCACVGKRKRWERTLEAMYASVHPSVNTHAHTNTYTHLIFSKFTPYSTSTTAHIHKRNNKNNNPIIKSIK